MVKGMTAVEFVGKGDTLKKKAYLIKKDDIKMISTK